MLLCGVGCAKSQPPFELRGSVFVPIPSGNPGLFADVICSGSGDHPDLHDGAAVVIRDADGDVVGRGALVGTPRAAAGCAFEFKIEDVESGHAEYLVAVGDQAPVRVDENDARNGNTEIRLT